MRKGFTLVELSIVLVIIGLLIGGILVAQSMMEATKLTKFVKQIQQMDILVSNFKTTYRYMPGDAPSISSAGNGDGNILAADGAIDNWSGEIANFWPQIYKAGMMNDGKIYTSSGGAGTFVFCGSNTVNGPVSPYQFSSKALPSVVGNGNCVGFVAYSAGGKHYYQTLSNTAQTSYAGKIRPDAAVVCYDGQLIDSKMDDGKRSAGKIVALNPQTLALNTTPVNTCEEPGYGWTEPDNGDYNCAMWAAHGWSCKQAIGGHALNLRFEVMADNENN